MGLVQQLDPTNDTGKVGGQTYQAPPAFTAPVSSVPFQSASFVGGPGSQQSILSNFHNLGHFSIEIPYFSFESGLHFGGTEPNST